MGPQRAHKDAVVRQHVAGVAGLDTLPIAFDEIRAR